MFTTAGRISCRNIVLLFLALFAQEAGSLSLSDLSPAEASRGLKAVLEKGADVAVSRLGVENGFLGNEKVRIPLPTALNRIRPMMEMTGRGHKLDALQLSMNRAAESAVALAKPVLLDTIKSMTVQDAKTILNGGESAVTDFFRGRSSQPLTQRFLPVVKSITDSSGLAAEYNGLVMQLGKLGLAQQPVTVEEYVTERALNALFLILAEEERAIRANPLAAGNAVISRVFGALR